MPDPLDLTGDIAAAIDSAVLRGAQLALAYVRDDGSPAVSFRGSTLVHGPQELAIWARKSDSGPVPAIASRPRVSLVFFEMNGPGPMFLQIEGRARVAPELNDEVWAAIVEGERPQDPERAGVAVLIDVDPAAGAGAAGFFQQARA